MFRSGLGFPNRNLVEPSVQIRVWRTGSAIPRERGNSRERKRNPRAREREREREREIIFEWKKFSCRGAWRRDSHRRLFTWAEKARCWIPGFGV